MVGSNQASATRNDCAATGSENPAIIFYDDSRRDFGVVAHRTGVVTGCERDSTGSGTKNVIRLYDDRRRAAILLAMNSSNF
jgi:hypothetical protein